MFSDLFIQAESEIGRYYTGWHYWAYYKGMALADELIADGVLRTPVLIEAFRAIDRIDFVTPDLRGEAYANIPLPIGQGQTISQPWTVAFMLELLQPQAGERILDVGSGSGWQTALLAQVVGTAGVSGTAGTVIGLEIIPELCAMGKANVGKYSFVEKGTVTIHCLSALDGFRAAAPFDKIIAGAAGETVPVAWQEQLAVGGKIVTPIGSSVLLLIKKSSTEWEREEHPGFAFVPLVAGND